MSDNTSTVFTPLDCLREDTKARFVLILLNHDGSDLAPSLQLFQRIWKNALLKAVVDGGTNLLYKNTSDSNEFIPDFISGDFDSAKPELLQFYRDKGCDIINTPDQDATGYSKCRPKGFVCFSLKLFDMTNLWTAYLLALDQPFDDEAFIHTLRHKCLNQSSSVEWFTWC